MMKRWWRLFYLPEDGELRGPIASKHLPSIAPPRIDGATLYATCADPGCVPPGPGCECGLYFARRFRTVASFALTFDVPLTARVFGVVEPVGAVRRDEGFGGRAAALRLHALHVHPETAERFGDDWRGRYGGVPIVPWRWRSSRSRGQAWMIDRHAS